MRRYQAVGKFELEKNVLVMRRIHVRLKLKAEGSDRETAPRVHGMIVDKCPVYRSLKAAMAMTTEADSRDRRFCSGIARV